MDDWYLHDVPRLISETDRLYARISERYPDRTKGSVTKQRTVEERQWGPTVASYEARFEAEMAKLGMFYVPKAMIPGPAFVFPLRDVDDTLPCAQVKPLEGSILAKDRYHFIGSSLIGPRWIGNDRETLRLVVETHSVMCVEGPFDLLAMRLAMPGYPFMGILTNALGKRHVAYLRILGVKKLFLMYDNEGKPEGNAVLGHIKDLAVSEHICPSKDPSDALKDEGSMRTLISRVKPIFRY